MSYPGKLLTTQFDFDSADYGEMTMMVVTNGKHKKANGGRQINHFGHTILRLKLKLEKNKGNFVYFHIAGLGADSAAKWGRVYVMDRREFTLYASNGGASLDTSRQKTFLVRNQNDQNKAKEKLMEEARVPRLYLLAYQNCQTFVERVLRAANIREFDMTETSFWGAAKLGTALDREKSEFDIDLPIRDFDRQYKH